MRIGKAIGEAIFSKGVGFFLVIHHRLQGHHTLRPAPAPQKVGARGSRRPFEDPRTGRIHSFRVPSSIRPSLDVPTLSTGNQLV